MTELWYRFNVFAERQFFEKTALIDGIIVPAHVIAYYELSFPEFLRQCELPFIVDPVTYVWNIDPQCISNGNGDIKKSYERLAEKYSSSVGRLLGKHLLRDVTISPDDFEAFVTGVLRFQLLQSDKDSPSRVKSISLLKKRISLIQGTPSPTEEKKRVPYALIPPYFFFRKVTDSAYEKTVRAFQIAQANPVFANFKIFPCLCMDRSVLNDAVQIEQILTDFQDCSGILLWINGFEETSASLPDLISLTTFIKTLSKGGKEIINLYGGYFSLLLKYAGLSKVSSGICYSSSRKVFSEASGGGLPVRYYEPNLKVKIMRENMFRLYNDKSFLFNCQCPICKEFIQKCKDQTGKREQLLSCFFLGDERGGTVIDWASSRLHFLHCRKAEQAKLQKEQVQDTIANIESSYNAMITADVDPIRYNFSSIDHLRNWVGALNSLL